MQSNKLIIFVTFPQLQPKISKILLRFKIFIVSLLSVREREKSKFFVYFNIINAMKYEVIGYFCFFNLNFAS